MKTRTDFVSNSSSSSFILYQTDFIEHFGITKKDIEDAVISLYGKDKYEAWLKDHTKEAGLAKIAEYKKESIENGGDGDVKWAEDYYTSEDFLNSKPFYVYDLEDDEDMAAAEKDFGCLLAGWDQRIPDCDELSDWYSVSNNTRMFQGFLKAVNETYGCFLHHGTDSELKIESISRRNFKLQKAVAKIPLIGEWLKYKIAWKPIPSKVKKMVHEVRQGLGIMTNLDVLRHECSRFFIHFEDNEMGVLVGMRTKGKNDDYGDGDGDDSLETEAYSCSRFMEILLKEWIKSGRVNVTDRGLLERYPISDYCKKQDPTRITWLPDGKYDVKTFIEETVATCNGHEG